MGDSGPPCLTPSSSSKLSSDACAKDVIVYEYIDCSSSTSLLSAFCSSLWGALHFNRPPIRLAG